MFMKLDANEQGTWYTTSDCIQNLARCCLSKIPKSIPPISRGPDVPFEVVLNEQLTKCSMQRSDLCTRVATHLLLVDCVAGKEDLSPATACGFCGQRCSCEVQVTRPRRSVRAGGVLVCFVHLG